METIKKHYCCFNKNYKESSEREILLKYLETNNLLNKGYVSTGEKTDLTFDELDIGTTLNKSLINIVPEGNFKSRDSQFLSEKIYRCFLFTKPFIILSRQNDLSYMRDIGYKTFEPIINEDYDHIYDHKTRLIEVCKEIKRITSKPIEEFTKDIYKLTEICEYNYKLYISNREREKRKFYDRITKNY